MTTREQHKHSLSTLLAILNTKDDYKDMEQIDSKKQEHEGERYLRLLGLEHLADREIATASGTIHARDFLEVCGEHARPMLVGFESMSIDDPRYETTKSALRGVIGQYVEGDNPS